MITIHRAITTEEKEAVYRFRYTVYVEEMGRYHATADHVNRRLVDPEDDRSWIYYAHDGTEVVASNRVTCGTHGFSSRQIEQYGLAPFIAELPARVLHVGERTMVAAAYRGTSVANDLSHGGEPPIPEEDVCVVFGACEPHLISFYVQLGMNLYAPRNMNSEESGYLIPLVTFPQGIEALDGLGADPGTPRCVQAVLDGLSAVTSPAVVGEQSYWELLEPTVRGLQDGRMWLFDGLTDDEIKCCVARSSIIECAPGDRVLKRGGSAHNAFVVLDGRLEARDGGRTVGDLAAGDVFGETAFLLQRPRTLDVFAVDPGTRILSLSERVVRNIMKDEPGIATTLLTNISKVLCTRAYGLDLQA
jgi:hypothetical protein